MSSVAARDHVPFAIVFGALIALAWIALAMWTASPWGRYLGDESWMQLGWPGAICRVVPGGNVLLPMAMHTLGWVLMSIAMMLPTTAPLLAAWRRLTVRRDDSRLLLGLVVAGFLAAWGAFGVAAHGVDVALQNLARRQGWLMLNGWVFGAAVLVGAGLFQFSALKRRCLDGCRSPLAFALDAWQRPRPRVQAWRLGLRHGIYCVGCCWALMLLMFVVGMASLGWMLLLAAVMAAEKNLPWGRRLSAPLGVALTSAGMALALVKLNGL
jgi:predicted metal-binding membrane protein